MKFLVIITILGLTVLSGFGATALAQVSDPVLDYYWQKAAQVALDTDPNIAGVSYQLTARTFKHSIERDGEISATDTVVQTLYFTDGELDSAIVVGDAESDQLIPTLTFPSVFDMDFDSHLFPNDTGGVDFPIGFLTDSARPEYPDGLAVIDRYQYHLRSLYLSYNNQDNYRRFSRSYRFVVVDDYLFPDSVWEIATRLGVFSSESYRMETGITDIRVQPAAESTAP